MQHCAGRLHLQMVSQKGERTLFKRLYWQLQQQQQPDTLGGPTVAGIGKPLQVFSHQQLSEHQQASGKPSRKGFELTDKKEDLRIEGIAQDVILKHEERMGKVREAVDKLLGASIELHELGQYIQTRPTQFLFEASTRGTDLL